MNNKIVKHIRSFLSRLKFFDWILIVFVIITVFVFAVILFRKSSYITATVSIGDDSVVYGTWNGTGPKDWFANSFHKGQTEKDGLGRIQSQVLDVYSYDTSVNHKIVYINVKLNSVYNRATNTYTYKGVPVLVGSTIKLNLDNVFAEGLVTEVKGYPSRAEKKTIKIEARLGDEETNFLGTAATKGYIADAIQTGDLVKDSNGTILIKIVDKRTTQAEATVTTSDGRLVKAIDPNRKDIFLTLEVLAEKQNGKYYFLNNIPILVDQTIPLNLSTISVFPTVTKFLTN